MRIFLKLLYPSTRYLLYALADHTPKTARPCLEDNNDIAATGNTWTT